MMSSNPYRVFAFWDKKCRKRKKKIKTQKKKKKIIRIDGWAKIRKKILDRDNYACRICCQYWDLHVHHIDYNRENNDSSNLVTLCPPCHAQVHRENYKPWEHEEDPPWGDVC